MTQHTVHGFLGKNGASFKTYLYRIARTTLIDSWRRENRAQQRDQAYFSAQPLFLTEQTDTPLDMQKFVAQLTPAEKHIVALLQQGYTQTEIAQLLQCSDATVTRRRDKIIEQGRRFFSDQERDSSEPDADDSAPQEPQS